MNIAQALKEKNRLHQKMEKMIATAIVNNRRDPEDINPKIDSIALLKEYEQLIDDLSKLKRQISEASVPVQNKIAKMTLLGKYKQYIENMSCSAEPYTRRGLDSKGDAQYREVRPELQINASEKQALSNKIQGQIDQLQDEIDTHNAVTQI